MEVVRLTSEHNTRPGRDRDRARAAGELPPKGRRHIHIAFGEQHPGNETVLNRSVKDGDLNSPSPVVAQQGMQGVPGCRMSADGPRLQEVKSSDVVYDV
jgi:hypothetical protein